VKIYDVTVPGGEAVNKVYQDSPNDSILQSVTVSALTFSVRIRASYPIVDIDGTLYTLLKSADDGHYEGGALITVTGTGPVTVIVQTADNNPGATDTIDVTVALPAEFTSFVFSGPYPTGPLGLQTEVKAGDQFDVTWTTDKPITGISTPDVFATIFETINFPSATSGTIQVTIADRGTTLQALPALGAPIDAVTGAYGTTRATNLGGGTTDGVHLVNLNNLAPTLNLISVSYPTLQWALKGSETANVVISRANVDGIFYDSPNGDLSIQNPSLDEPVKTVARIAGSYNDSVDNLRGVATRAANGAQTTDTQLVVIANVAATVDISVPAARLRSGGNNGTSPQDYTVQIISSQKLNFLFPPSVDADPGGNRGTFQGSAFAPLTDYIYTRDLRVDETVPDEKGTFSFQNLSVRNLAGIIQTVINSGASYTLGGFVQRNLTFAAFATTTSLDTEVVDFSKLQAGIFTSTNQPAQKQPIGTPPPVTDGYTINAVGVNPTTLIWSDTAAAGANSSGTAQITDVEETV
jgi:hypothetical protein